MRPSKEFTKAWYPRSLVSGEGSLTSEVRTLTPKTKILTGRVSSDSRRPVREMRSPSPPNISFSSGESLLYISGVLDKETAKNAPAVADSRATPIMPTPNQSQRPGFT